MLHNMRLDMIGLIVEDIPRSLAFYSRLGMPVDETAVDGPYYECTFSGIRFSWNALSMIKEIDPHWVPPVGERSGMAFLAESPSGVDAKYAEMTAAGYRGVREPWDAFWGQRYAQVEDPDGNKVDLFAPLEG
jgi:catechol 2,3-dioxygenase-like lactoylglutathione lyase family enzyme